MKLGGEQAEPEIPRELPNWEQVCCTECDSVVGYTPPDVKVHGDQFPIYCFQCAKHLDVKDN